MEVLDMLREVLIGAAGAGIGFLVARNVLEKKYARLLDEEIERTKEFFGADYEGSKEGLDDPEFMQDAINAAEALTEYVAGDVKIVPSVLAENVERTVTAYNKPGAPSIVEEEVRDIESNVAASPLDPDARAPHLITFAEFDAGDLGYAQVSVSFFAGDGIVIDEEDNVISPDRVEQIIGTDNLNKFGTNTDDPDLEPNVIYVRCERFNMDFEVTRSPGKHSVEVLGETG
jgi:hypothetical protein